MGLVSSWGTVQEELEWLEVWPGWRRCGTGSGYGLVGGGVALGVGVALLEVVGWKWAARFQNPTQDPVSFSLPAACR
jgi:hypothetical protein